MKVELANLIEPTIEQLGYELSDLELKLGGRDGIVRVFIDSLQRDREYGDGVTDNSGKLQRAEKGIPRANHRPRGVLS